MDKILNLDLPDELNFLREVDLLPSIHTQFSLLESNYHDQSWIISGLAAEINFKIHLSDGSLLTDPANKQLLDSIKHWIAYQSLPTLKTGFKYNEAHVLKRIRYVIHIIDYLLLSNHNESLITYGFACITNNTIKSIIYKICTSTDIGERFYDLGSKLTNYLRAHYLIFNETVDELIDNAAQSIVVPESEYILQFSKAEIICIRRALFSRSTYSLGQLQHRPGLLLKPIYTAIYKNTLHGCNLTNHPKELLITPSNKLESPKAQIRSTHKTIVSQNYRIYMSCIKSLGGIASFGLPSPSPCAFDELSGGADSLLEISKPHRFRSLPMEVAFKSLKYAIEFVLIYGESILESCANFMIDSYKSKNRLVRHSKNVGVKNFLVPGLSSLEITCWSVKLEPPSIPYNYPELLRKSPGLHDLVKVFFGASQVIFGTLSARRQSELLQLYNSNANEQSLHIFFPNSKSGFEDSKEYISRPIPLICIKICNLIKKFQTKLISANLLNGYYPLFSIPNVRSPGLKFLVATQFNDSLNVFCDYMETPRDESGHRYYIRAHQLRRFFAQAFFWSSFGDENTLRWMLGHTDLEHLYRYISEAIPGDILRSVKSDFTVECIRRGNSSLQDLETLVFKEFNTNNFSILDKEELTAYLEMLMLDGKLSVEPKFITSATGVQYEIIFKVNKVGN